MFSSGGSFHLFPVHSALRKFWYRKLMISNFKLYKFNKASRTAFPKLIRRYNLRITIEHFLFYRTLSTTGEGNYSSIKLSQSTSATQIFSSSEYLTRPKTCKLSSSSNSTKMFSLKLLPSL